jgi:hypothetical protein
MMNLFVAIRRKQTMGQIKCHASAVRIDTSAFKSEIVISGARKYPG